MASDQQILNQWDDYYSEYGSNLAEQESDINDKLNSNDYSNEQKAKMAHDLEMQKEYYRQLGQNKTYINDYYQQHGELPATVNFNVKGSGLIYQSTGSTGDGKIHSVRQIAGGYISSSDATYNYYCVAESDQMKLIVKTSKDSSIVTKGSFSNDANNYHYTGASLESTSNTWRDAWYYDQKGYLTGTTNQMFQREQYKYYFGTRADTDTTHSPPTISSMSIDNLLRGSTSTTLSVSVSIGVGQEYDEGDTDVPTDAPWDYFNDMNEDINPDNSVFPNGYHPPDPHDPPIEPEMDESDEGTPPEPVGWNGMITSPSLFITQYILNSSLLELLGENLWQSWLTTNTDVWENFLFNFASQTGTFNITAALDYIISLRVFPFDLRYLYTNPPEGFYGQSDGVYMGTGKTNFTYQYTTLPIKTINSVSAMIPMGEITVESAKPYDDFRDIYNCSILCYLPFCGTAELNPADVYGRKLKCTYFVDFQSGGCTALVECEGDTGWFPVATKSGVIGFTIPLTATNAGQLAAQFASDAVRAVGTMSGMYFGIGSSVGNGVLGALGAGEDLGSIASSVFNGTLGVGQATVNAGLSLANQAVDMLSRSGINMPMLSGGTGCENLMMYRDAFVEIRRGKYAKPENFPHSLGYANATSKKLEEFHGMNCFVGVDVSGLECHGDELAEIVAILETGVYLP